MSRTTTTQRPGATPMAALACRKRSGAGLPRETMLALKMFGSNLSMRPVTVSDRRMRSSWLEEATQWAMPSPSTVSAMPSMALSSARKRS